MMIRTIKLVFLRMTWSEAKLFVVNQGPVTHHVGRESKERYTQSTVH